MMMMIMMMISFLAVAATVGLASAGPAAPFRLRLEYMKDPQGVDVSYAPRATWALGHTERGQSQSGYRIAVSRFAGHGWVPAYDSGKVTGNASQNVHLAATLTPDTLYSWSVMYVDAAGEASPWAANATFSTGVEGWAAAQWIGQASGVTGPFQARTTFVTAAGKTVARVTIYAVGLGYYKLFVRQLRPPHFGPSLRDTRAPQHHIRAVGCALRGDHAH